MGRLILDKADHGICASGQGDLQWRTLRKGIADLHRRTDVSQKANQRLLNALASVDDSRSVEELTTDIQKRASMGWPESPGSTSLGRRQATADRGQPWRVHNQRIPEPQPPETAV